MTTIKTPMIVDINKRLPLVTKLISYQDTEVHNGTIYKAANWNIDGVTKFNSWGNSRKRSKDQSTADKVRWGYTIFKYPPYTNFYYICTRKEKVRVVEIRLCSGLRCTGGEV